ncbi:MAG: hypothetical protein HYR63_04910 [Proteobacteria bacterium]|nr:hypothetical protein [Pseudomonadota bacterium]MBI3496622.1 hypothetical protein [Pseudomonadota bacterium]
MGAESGAAETVDRAMLATIIGRADEALAEKDLSQVNRLLRALVQVGVEDAALHRRLAEVCRRLGLDAHAAYHEGLAGSPVSPTTAGGASAPADPAAAAPRYLLIRAWGAGFWGDVAHVGHQLLLAEITGRIPVVYWGRESRYRRSRMDNAWEAYFQPVSPVRIADLERDDYDFFPPKWTHANLRTPRINKDSGPWSRISGLYLQNRPERVVVSDYFTELDDILPFAAVGPAPDAAASEALLAACYRRHIKLMPHLKIAIERFAAELLAERPVLGVHYRAPAFVKTLESAGKDTIGVETYFAEIDRFLEHHPSGSVFLMTDFVPALAEFQARYGQRLKTRTVLRLVHAEDQSLEYNTALDGRTLATEVIIDVYLALASDRFLGDQVSGVTQAVARLKEWPADKITLFRRAGAWPLGFVRQHSDPTPWWNPPD